LHRKSQGQLPPPRHGGGSWPSGCAGSSDRAAVLTGAAGLRRSSPGSARPTASHQHRADRGVLGQRRRRELLRRLEKRAVLPAALPRQGAGPVRRRRATSRSSTTGNGCTQPSATARPWKHSHSSRPQQPLHDQKPGKLSKIVTQLITTWPWSLAGRDGLAAAHLPARRHRRKIAESALLGRDHVR
jgi:hypothetical protein